MRSKVVSLQVGNFHVGKSWQLESERFTCLREGGGLCWAPQHMLGSTIYVGAQLHVLGHHYIFTCLREGGGLCLGITRYVVAQIIYVGVGAQLNML